MKKFNTSTLLPNEETVPWLASKGELAYSVDNPPKKDYYFKYNFILQDILNNKINKREHRYFGCKYKNYDVKILLDFWNSAGLNNINHIYYSNGKKEKYSCTAPIAVYLYSNRKYLSKDIYILIQHGSYQMIESEGQPYIKDGYVVLYSGIGKKKIFKHLSFKENKLNNKAKKILRQFNDIQYDFLSDSVKSFKLSHHRIKRSETSCLNEDFDLFYNHAEKHEKKFMNNTIAETLWFYTDQCYSLHENITRIKFGPNYAKYKTPLNNIRITTFFAGEYEIKVLNPNKVELINITGGSAKSVDL